MIFVDTWAWIGLAVERDQHHALVMAEHTRLQRTGAKYLTTDFVLNELICYLFSVGPSARAQQYVNSLLTAADHGRHTLVHVSPKQFRQAWVLRQRYADKSDISFVDFTSMAVMLELGVAEVFTGDAHFQQVGLGFQLVPAVG